MVKGVDEGIIDGAMDKVEAMEQVAMDGTSK